MEPWYLKTSEGRCATMRYRSTSMAGRTPPLLYTSAANGFPIGYVFLLARSFLDDTPPPLLEDHNLTLRAAFDPSVMAAGCPHGATGAFLRGGRCVSCGRKVLVSCVSQQRYRGVGKELSDQDFDVSRAVEWGNVGRCPWTVHCCVHGLNLFTVFEAKGRRRTISELHLNKVLKKYELPLNSRTSRLQRRQKLRPARYMLHVDFEAFYDAMPLPENCTLFFAAKEDFCTV
eukprot:gene7534-biopygen5122